jgi:hypothetical protein
MMMEVAIFMVMVGFEICLPNNTIDIGLRELHSIPREDEYISTEGFGKQPALGLGYEAFKAGQCGG